MLNDHLLDIDTQTDSGIMPFVTEKASDQDFETLGLEPDAPPDRVKKAYRRLVKSWHPDRFQQRSSRERRRAEERLKEITGAYRRISKRWKPQGSPKHGSQAGTERVRRTRRSPDKKEEFGRKADTGGFSNRPAGAFSSLLRIMLPWRSGFAWRRSGLALALFLILLIFAANWTSLSEWFGDRSGDLHDEPHRQSPIPSLPPHTGQAPEEGPLPDLKESPHTQTVTPSPLASPPPAPHVSGGDYFTLGSSEAEVLRIQGPPARTHGQTWTYGLSEVQFKDGRVWRFNNFDDSLKVRLKPQTEPDTKTHEFFTLGSTQDQVLLVQGTPTRVEANKWHFGFSEVRFRNGRVQDFDNYFGNLKIRLLPASPSNPALHKGYFTIGSSQDEVLAVQGTPTSVQGNFWFYQFSNVLFREGKVQYVVNSTGNLHFVPPEEINEKGKHAE